MTKRVLIFLAALIFVLGIGLAAIFYLRGFKIDTKKGTIARTGLLVIDSTPDGAQVFLDDRLTSATDTTITFLTPKKYKLKLTKEGYTPWEKEIEIKADLTTEVIAVLFPSIPELRPLSFSGVSNPILSPDEQKIVFGIPQKELAGLPAEASAKVGLWVLNMADRPFGFGAGSRQIVKNTPDLDFTKAKMAFSPDTKFIWVQLQLQGKVAPQFQRNYLLDTEKLNDALTDVTATLSSTLSSWQQEINLKQEARNLRLKKDLPQIASASSTLLDQALKQATTSAVIEPKLLNFWPDNLFWSPDETKFFTLKGKTAKDGVTVYRVRDPNPLKKTPATFDIPGANQVLWYPDSDHLILVGDKEISIIEYEGTNKVTVYTGDFVNSFVFPWPNGTSLVILSNFNQAAGTLPNLYALKLR
jgi:hypothetical protein